MRTVSGGRQLATRLLLLLLLLLPPSPGITAPHIRRGLGNHSPPHAPVLSNLGQLIWALL